MPNSTFIVGGGAKTGQKVQKSMTPYQTEDGNARGVETLLFLSLLS